VIGPTGVAHRVQLRAAGVPVREIRFSLEHGLIRQIRRDWFATESCDSLLQRAVYAGVTLSCVSAAVVHGLWDVRAREVHVAASRHTPRIHHEKLAGIEHGDRPLRVHWVRAAAPGPAPRVREVLDDVPRTLVRIAHCQPTEAAVAIFDSALRRGSASMHELRELGATDAAVRRTLQSVQPLADSGYESLTRVRLERIGVRMTQQVVIDGHPVDGMIGQRLLVQIDGWGPHSSRSQRNRDLAQDERLRRRGYVVLRFSVDQVEYEWAMIESAVLSVIATGAHNW
jgi:very-short-patch-repair endonuclease